MRVRRPLLVLVFAGLVVTGATLTIQSAAETRPATFHAATPTRESETQTTPRRTPVREASSTVNRARAACPAGRTSRCRAAIVRLLQAVEWQRKARWHAQAIAVRDITLDAITWAAKRYHVSAAAMRTVANCESHYWPFATNGQYKGPFQLGARHREDPIFRLVPWQDAYAQAAHVARYVKQHGYSEWQCRPDGSLGW